MNWLLPTVAVPMKARLLNQLVRLSCKVSSIVVKVVGFVVVVES